MDNPIAHPSPISESILEHMEANSSHNHSVKMYWHQRLCEVFPFHFLFASFLYFLVRETRIEPGRRQQDLEVYPHSYSEGQELEG